MTQKNNQKPNRLIEIGKYIFSAVYLYGVIELSDFVFVFNHYEDDQITKEEALSLIEVLLYYNVTNLQFKHNILANGFFNFKDHRSFNKAKEILSIQKHKPRFLPSKNEFLKYEDEEYVEPMKPLIDLEKFITGNQLVEIEEAEDIRFDVLELHDQTVSGSKISEYFSYVDKRGYKFHDEFEMQLFIGLVTHVQNNTRLYENCGYTPNELLEYSKKGRF
jgi:hypothetical protein